MKKLIGAFAVVCVMVGGLQAQTLGIGGQQAAGFATALPECQTVTTGYFLCPVVPGDGVTQPFLALSVAGFNNGAPFQLGMQGPPGPPGNPGGNGTNATVSVGTITTLPAGSQATVTNTGTQSAAVFNFGIPQGAPGSGTGGNVQMLLGGGSNSVVGSGATTYFSLEGAHVANSYAPISEEMFPAAGTIDQLCVRTASMQSGGSLTLTVFDTTANTATSLVVTIPGISNKGLFCDMTDVVTVTPQDDYVLRAVNTWTNTSAAVLGISARYTH